MNADTIRTGRRLQLTSVNQGSRGDLTCVNERRGGSTPP